MLRGVGRDTVGSGGQATPGEPPACGPTGHHRTVLLALAADPSSSIAGIARDYGISPEAVTAILDDLLADGYVNRRSVDGGELCTVEEEAPLRACGWCAGARLGDLLALEREWSHDGDAVGFSRAVERLAWGSPRPR